jgi:hyperosmotically inducible protein
MNQLLKSSVIAAAVCASLLTLAACNQQADTDHAPAASVGTSVDDSVITTKVKTALLANENIKSLDITVTTSKGIVMLSGFVNNKEQIDLSTSLAKAIQGVVSVDNQLTLKTGINTVGAKIDDDVITTKVRSALINDAAIKSFDISVVTRNGEVQLSGFVDNAQQVQHSIEVAQAIEGVKSVSNHMTIKN